MEYLGLWVTRNGVKSTNKNIEAITNTNPPNFQKEVQNFIGVIIYYRDMWPSRSHTLAPFTKRTSIKKTFKWTKVEQDNFKKIRWIVNHDTL